jgi:hypothetical protein
MQLSNNFYSPFDNMVFSYDYCFLCGKKLKIKTAEHVFPKWLMNKFELWDQKITLLNKTKIYYRNLTIPCCEECNNMYLSKIEKKIKDIYNEGFNKLLGEDELLIYQWIGKIYYGLLFRELSLLIDRKNPAMGNIMNKELLYEFKTFHGFLQSIRIPLLFEDFTPWSIFILKLHIDNRLDPFDYRDSFPCMTFSIRMGNIGIIACLEDNGVQNEMFGDYYRKLQKIKLHPIQFDELFAKVTYKSSLLNRVPKYMAVLPENEKDVTRVNKLPLQGLSLNPIYNNWNQKEYSMVLEFYLQNYTINKNKFYWEPDQVISFIEDEQNRIKILNDKAEIIGYLDN